jgi:hypothetical protein
MANRLMVEQRGTPRGGAWGHLLLSVLAIEKVGVPTQIGEKARHVPSNVETIGSVLFVVGLTLIGQRGGDRVPLSRSLYQRFRIAVAFPVTCHVSYCSATTQATRSVVRHFLLGRIVIIVPADHTLGCECHDACDSGFGVQPILPAKLEKVTWVTSLPPTPPYLRKSSGVCKNHVTGTTDIICKSYSETVPSTACPTVSFEASIFELFTEIRLTD